jgi:hypothetical protein
MYKTGPTKTNHTVKVDTHPSKLPLQKGGETPMYSSEPVRFGHVNLQSKLDIPLDEHIIQLAHYNKVKVIIKQAHESVTLNELDACIAQFKKLIIISSEKEAYLQDLLLTRQSMGDYVAYSYEEDTSSYIRH